MNGPPSPADAPAEPNAASAPLLEVSDLRRAFGETIALDSCSLTVQRGEIHAVVGENGSGKSTLIKVLSGIVAPGSGSLRWDGAPMHFRSPAAAQRAGIATVFQETLVLLEMSVRDNVMLGLDGIVRRRMGKRREAEMCREALAVVGLGDIDIERPTGGLPLASRQLVGVARSLMRPWRLLILDESTSAIDIEDRDRLFDALKGFRTAGRSILFVSHRMDEIEALADRTTVLRSGRSVATLSTVDCSTDALLELMSTREGAKAAEGHGSRRVRSVCTDRVIRVRQYATRAEHSKFDFDLHAGEIVGVGGLEGHGQLGFLECVAGFRRPLFGSVEVGDTVIRGRNDAARNDIAFLPRDRKTEGIFAGLSVIDNITVSCLSGLASWGIVRPSRRSAKAKAVAERTKVTMTSPHLPIASLSGGNQQKALLGRLIATNPRVLVLNDPLRGVDLAAKRDLYGVLTELAEEGAAILLLSTELVELCLLCDRVVVFHDHAVSAVIDQDALDERSLIGAMFGRASLAHATSEASP